ncbi:metal-dependent hydrolase [Vibrio taketomensis]|uniref:metal-dependent hydrolase n=1 Tax=Vibrio taketomensis TaxID=2572923 RepID=UPI001389D17C|nr:metal-dependent hydrolase [Vibrio taketomensis]
MDPLTQGVLGASFSQSVSKKQHIVVAGILGLLSAMSPDLDVLIRSTSDPLLFLEYHRQFTHSLLFIPIGSLICCLVLHPLIAKKRGFTFKQSWLYCALGFGSHALLDACTSYGTQLLWPFSEQRFAWNMVSVVDPIFTLPIVALFVFAMLKRNRCFARITLLWAVGYLVLAAVQRERAEEAGWQLAAERDHSPLRLQAKPSFGNILVWKVVYETNEHFYVDAVRVGTSAKYYQGSAIAKLDLQRDFPWLKNDSQQSQDIMRFNRFSEGYLAQDPHNNLRIIDVRYSMIPNQIKPLWSIQLSPSASTDAHVAYLTHRENSKESTERLIEMIFDF